MGVNLREARWGRVGQVGAGKGILCPLPVHSLPLGRWGAGPSEVVARVFEGLWASQTLKHSDPLFPRARESLPPQRLGDPVPLAPFPLEDIYLCLTPPQAARMHQLAVPAPPGPENKRL